MNRLPAAIASILFFIVIMLEVLFVGGNYTPVQQSIKSISYELFNTYLIPFELLSVVLVAGIIGMFHNAEDDE